MTSDDPASTAKDIAGNVSADARDAAGRLASDAADRGRTAAARAADTAHHLYDKAKDTVAGIGDRVPGSAGETLEAGRRAYARSSDQVGRQIARQPIEALLLAGAIGYLVGWAANRT